MARLSQLPLQHALHDWCLRRVRSIQQSVDPLKGQSVFIILALSLYYTMKGLEEVLPHRHHAKRL